MFNVDIGVTIPFALTKGGVPLNLTGATEVKLLLSDGTSLTLAVTDAAGGLAEYVVAAGALAAGFKRGNVRVTYDATHVYHSETFAFHVSVLFT
jgi:hypothetical protein